MRANDGKLHWSDLKHIGTSPKKYLSQLSEPFSDTRSYIIGRATHSQWLTGVRYPIWTETKRDMRIKEYAEAFKKHGERLLNAAENNVVQDCVNALNDSELAMQIKERCTQYERELQWTRRNIECAGRIDMMGPGIMGELKTAETAHPGVWRRKALRYGYHAQLAWYNTATGVTPDQFTPWPDTYCIVVETVEPFDVVAHQLDNLLLDDGNKLIERWLDRYEECKRANIYPGYASEILHWDAEVKFGAQDDEDEFNG